MATLDERTVGDLLVECLAAAGAELMLGAPRDSLTTVWDEPRLVEIEPPADAAFAAVGYARACGRAPVLLLPSLVAGLGAAPALWEARGGCVPLVVVAIRTPGDPDEAADALAALAGWRVAPAAPDEVAPAVAESFRVARGSPPGPALVMVSFDLLGRETDLPAPFVLEAEPDPPPTPNDGRVAAVAQLLETAQRPLVVVGGAARGARAEVVAMADRLGAPILLTSAGEDVVEAGHARAVRFSEEASVELTSAADVVVAAGIEHASPLDGLGLGEVRVVIDPRASAVSPGEAVHALHDDVGLACAALARGAIAPGEPPPPPATVLVADFLGGGDHPADVRVIRAVDAETVGFAEPAAIGVRLALPDATVIVEPRSAPAAPRAPA